ncbi:hypothetical protein M9H77_11473 [Catharanthus roseus]|uniref:Uncharacterized protein n=1 Tax=Catharanthus roseus TaxID=4058 RepID=A0ACC0BEQ8_CATRO|nr:hypothetical protein M9H77_11473 [Catharanthus roseus]
MSASILSTRWSRFSMCTSTAPMPSSTRVRRDSKLAVRSLDFPLGFGITGSRCSSRPQPFMASTKALIPLVTYLLFLVSRRAALALPQMLRKS